MSNQDALCLSVLLGPVAITVLFALILAPIGLYQWIRELKTN